MMLDQNTASGEEVEAIASLRRAFRNLDYAIKDASKLNIEVEFRQSTKLETVEGRLIIGATTQWSAKKVLV